MYYLFSINLKKKGLVIEAIIVKKSFQKVKQKLRSKTCR